MADDLLFPPANDDIGFAALRPRLLRIARGRIGPEAEDVVHDAWLRWREAGPARPDDAGAWLGAVVVRLCVDRMRRADVRARHAETIAGAAEAAAPSAESRVLEARTVRDALAEVLRRLSPAEAAAWLLHEVLDVDHAELARLLGCSEAACRQRVRRARERLRDTGDAPRAAGPADPRTLERCLQAIRSADRRALVAALIASQPEASGRDRVHERIRCERRPDGELVLRLGEVVLAVVPLDDPVGATLEEAAAG